MNLFDKEKLKLHNKWQGATKESILTFIHERKGPLGGLPLEFGNDKEVALAAIDYYNAQDVFEYASKELQNDRDFVLHAVTRCKWVLYRVSPNFQDDFGVVSAAMSSIEYSSRHIAALDGASPRLRSNRNIVLKAVESFGLELKYVNPIFFDDEEIVITAFENSRDDGSQYYGKPHTISEYISPKMWKKINKMEKKEEMENKENSTLLTDKIAEASDKMIGGLENMFMYFSDYKKEERRAEKDWMQKQAEQWQRTYKDCQEQWKNDVDEWQEKIIKWQQDQKNSQYESYVGLRAEIEQMPISQRWKQDVRKKCENKCQMCGSNKNTEVHHLDSFYLILKQNNINSIEKAFECKKLWNVDNGEVLCKKCHDKMESSKYRALKNST